jgi:hypothetical protein
MNRARTELSFVSEAVKLARQLGFRELQTSSRLAPGALPRGTQDPPVDQHSLGVDG